MGPRNINAVDLVKMIHWRGKARHRYESAVKCSLSTTLAASHSLRGFFSDRRTVDCDCHKTSAMLAEAVSLVMTTKQLKLVSCACEVLGPFRRFETCL